MDTVKKLQKVFGSITSFKTDRPNAEDFQDGLIFAMDTMKIWFDREEIIAAGIDPRLQHEIEAENKLKSVNKALGND